MLICMLARFWVEKINLYWFILDSYKCDMGWTYFESSGWISCYLFDAYPSYMDFTSASNHCNSYGGGSAIAIIPNVHANNYLAGSSSHVTYFLPISI